MSPRSRFLPLLALLIFSTLLGAWAANPVITTLCELGAAPSVDESSIYNGAAIHPTVSDCPKTVTWASPPTPALNPGHYFMVTYADGVETGRSGPLPISGSWRWEMRNSGGGVGDLPLSISFPPGGEKPSASVKGILEWTNPCSGEKSKSEFGVGGGPNGISLGSAPPIGTCDDPSRRGGGGPLGNGVVIGPGMHGDWNWGGGSGEWGWWGYGWAEWNWWTENCPECMQCDQTGPEQIPEGEFYIYDETVIAYANRPGRGRVPSLTRRSFITPLSSPMVSEESRYQWISGISAAAFVNPSTWIYEDEEDNFIGGTLKIHLVEGFSDSHSLELQRWNELSGEYDMIDVMPDSSESPVEVSLDDAYAGGCGIYKRMLNQNFFRFRRDFPGTLVLRFTVELNRPNSVSSRSALLELKGEPMDPPSNTATLSYYETGGNRYRKVNLRGMPMPDGKPQTEKESDVDDESGSIDALTLNLSHDTTDLYVPLVGEGSSLAVRRQHVQEIWTNDSTGDSPNALSPFNALERPFGAGWRSGLAAGVRMSINTSGGPIIAYVTDEQGATHRFARIWRNATTGIDFIPLPSSITDQDSFLMTLKVMKNASGVVPTDPQQWKFEFRRKFGTVLHFEPLPFSGNYDYTHTTSGIKEQSLINTNLVEHKPSPTSVTRQDYYYRIKHVPAGSGGPGAFSVRDSNGNRLYYSFDGVPDRLFPSSIRTDSGVRLEIAAASSASLGVSDGAPSSYVSVVKMFPAEAGAAALEWMYLYDTESLISLKGNPLPGFQELVRLIAVRGPENTVERAYSYELKQEWDASPQANNNNIYHYHYLLSGIMDGGGYRHSLQYTANRTRKIFKSFSQLGITGWYIQHGLPFQVSNVYFQRPSTTSGNPYDADGHPKTAYPAPSTSYEWTSSFTSNKGLNGTDVPYYLTRDPAGKLKVEGASFTTISDASQLKRTWIFQDAEILSAEALKDYLFPNVASATNPVVQICWKTMEIHHPGQGTTPSLFERYEFKPECGMALGRSTDLSGAITEWTYADDFKARWFVPYLNGLQVPGTTVAVDSLPFFPQKYSDPTSQTRYLTYKGVAGRTDTTLVRNYEYWSSNSADPVRHQQSWSRRMTKVTDENNNVTTYTLDDSPQDADPLDNLETSATGRTLTETTGSTRVTDYWYGTPGGSRGGADQPAFVWKTSVANGVAAGSALITTREKDAYWRVSKETVGNAAGTWDDKSVTRFKYNSLGRLLATANGSATSSDLSLAPEATLFEYTNTGLLKKTQHPAAGVIPYYPAHAGRPFSESQYDPYRGTAMWAQNERGVKTHFTYDSAGRVNSNWIDLNGNGVHDAAAEPKELWEYSPAGFMIKHISVSGLISLYYYNRHGAMEEVQVGDPDLLVPQPTGNPLPPPPPMNGRTEYSKTYYTYDFKTNFSGSSAFTSGSIKPSSISGPFRFHGDSIDGEHAAVKTFTYDSVGRKVKETAELTSTGAAVATEYFYDGNGNLTDIKDPSGYVTKTTYDALNRPLTVTRAHGTGLATATTTTYTAAGLPLTLQEAVISGNGGNHNRIKRFSYDAAGRKKLEFLPDPTSGTAETNWSVEHSRNSAGLVEKTRQRISSDYLQLADTLYEYDTSGLLHKTTLPAVPNADDNIPPVEQPASAVLRTWYDVSGNPTKKLDARANDSYVFYDDLSRPVRTVSAKVLIHGVTGLRRLATITEYDVAGNPEKVHSGRILPENGHEGTLFETTTGDSIILNFYSRRGFLKETHSHPNQLPGISGYLGTRLVTKFDYDVVGNKIKVTDPNNNVTAFRYDPLGRVTQTILHDGSTIKEITENTYNHAVLLSTTEKSRGSDTRTKTFGYDARYNLTSVSYSANPSAAASPYSEVRTVSTAGELLSVSCAGAPYRNADYWYDRRGRLFRETSLGQTHYYSLDNPGNRRGAHFRVTGNPTDPSVAPAAAQSTVTYTYDLLNRLESVVEGGLTTGYRYDVSGNLRRKKFPNNITEEKTFDSANRVTELKRSRAALTDALDVTVYTYNAHSSVASIAETYPASAAESGKLAAARTTANTYDRTQRLLGDSYASANNIFGYDKAGNRIQRSGTVVGSYLYGPWTGDSDNDGLPDVIYGTNQLWQVTHGSGSKTLYRYDDYGNRTHKRSYGPSGWTIAQETRYFWDQDNKITKIETQALVLTSGVWNPSGTISAWEFYYDHRGRRVLRNGPAANDSEALVYSGGNSVLQYPILDSEVANWKTTPSAQNPSASTALTYVRGSDMGGGVGGILYSLASGTPTYQQHNTRGDVTAYTNSLGKFTFQSTYESFGKHVDFGTAPAKRTQRASSKEEEAAHGLLNEGFRYRDTETGGFLSRDPAGFVDGPNLYSYVLQNPWSAFDPEGLATKSQLQTKLRELNEEKAYLQKQNEDNPSDHATIIENISIISDRKKQIENISARIKAIDAAFAVIGAVAKLHGENVNASDIELIDDASAEWKAAQPGLKSVAAGVAIAEVYAIGKISNVASRALGKLYRTAKWTPHPGFQMPAADKGRFLGDIGNSRFSLSDDAAAAMGLPRGSTVPWRKGIPDFGDFAVSGPGGITSTFSVSGLTGAHAADRTLMVQHMAAQTGMSQRAVQQWLSTNNVRLHHAGGNAVQIVPAPVHGLHHSGGAQQLRGGN